MKIWRQQESAGFLTVPPLSDFAVIYRDPNTATLMCISATIHFILVTCGFETGRARAVACRLLCLQTCSNYNGIKEDNLDIDPDPRRKRKFGTNTDAQKAFGLLVAPLQRCSNQV